jgi:hypothetical protein
MSGYVRAYMSAEMTGEPKWKMLPLANPADKPIADVHLSDQIDFAATDAGWCRRASAVLADAATAIDSARSPDPLPVRIPAFVPAAAQAAWPDRAPGDPPLPVCGACGNDLPGGGDLCGHCLAASPPRPPGAPLGAGPMAGHAVDRPDPGQPPMRYRPDHGGGHPYPAAGEDVPRPGQDDAQGSVTAPGSRGPGHAGPDRAQAAGKPGSSGTAARGPDLAEPLEPLPPKEPGNDESMAGFLASTDAEARRDDRSFADAWGKPDGDGDGSRSTDMTEVLPSAGDLREGTK